MKKYLLFALMLICLPVLGIGQSVMTLSITGYDARCNGSASGSAKVFPAGGVAPYSYSWSPVSGTDDSVSGLAAGAYSVTVTDSEGNVAAGAVTIGQPAPLDVSIDSIVVPPCFRTTSGECGCFNTLWAVVSGGTPPYSYLWSPGDSTGDTLLHACYLEFSVRVTDNNACITTDSVSVVAPSTHLITTASVSQVSAASLISLYPNPASDELNLTVSPTAGTDIHLSVYDMIGRKVLEQTTDANTAVINIDVSRLIGGNYLLKADGDEWNETTRFSISR